MSSSIEIENVLRHNKTFKGCYAHDNLPTITKFPCSLIINTDNHDRPGDHWVGLVLNKKKCFYFDSYGAPVLSTHILLFLCDKYKEIVFSTKQVQSIYSDKCGHFAIAFITSVHSIKSYEKFIHIFHSNNLIDNDNISNNIVNCIKK